MATGNATSYTVGDVTLDHLRHPAYRSFRRRRQQLAG
jgi:uncharacterized FlgJ-related protein